MLPGFPDTTQDADLFVEKSPRNGQALVRALREIGFELTEEQAEEVRVGRDFIQLRNGPFDLAACPRRGCGREPDAATGALALDANACGT